MSNIISVSETSNNSLRVSAREDSGAYSWYVVGVLMLCYALSFIDRQILSLLVEPIKHDLSLTDTEFGLLQGFAFAIFYTFVGLYIGKLADTKNRRWIIVIGVAAWSVMTALCGLAKSYALLFAARAGVAVGEASLSPAAYSIIGDYFPPRKLGRAMSVYTMGVYLGSGLAFLVGGTLIAAMPEQATFAVVGELKAWQLIFIIIGAPGLALSALVLTIKEPVRGRYVPNTGGSSTAAKKTTEPSVFTALQYFASNWRMYLMHFLGFSLLTMIGYAFHAWVPAYFIRVHAWEASEIGITYGAITILCAPAGVLAGGWFGDFLIGRGFKDAHMRGPLIGALALWIPAALATTLTTDVVVIFTLLALLQFFASFHGGLAVASLHTVTPLAYRAQATALYLFFINLIGMGLGPLLVALMTDYVFVDEAAVGSSLALIGAIATPLAIIFLWFGKKQFSVIVKDTAPNTAL